MRFKSARAIQKWAIDTHNCHPTLPFIRKWTERNFLTITGEWSEEDLIKMINEGDRAYAESQQDKEP